MNKAVLHILWMYPDILNLHGDRGNVMALQRVGAQFGVETEIRRVSRLRGRFDLGWADLLVFGAGELAVMPEVASALAEGEDAVRGFLAGKAVFCTGTTGAIFARGTERTDGSVLAGLGLLDMWCRERAAPLGDDLIFRMDGLDENICGIQIQMMDVFLAAGQAPLGRTVYGHGNCGDAEIRAEGAVCGNILFTNALGPVLVKNPWMALWLLRRALPGANLPDPNAPENARRWELELKSSLAVHLFNATKEKP
jgi:CobQ-like glutamine amidotransferase family enzyme